MLINLNSIIQNKRSGSSKIIKNTLELLKKVKEEERVEICKKIVNAHSSMSGLKFIMESLKINPEIDILMINLKKWTQKHGKFGKDRWKQECDAVVVGADSLLKTGFINKTGTLPLALTAKHLHREFYVAAPSYKFSNEYPELDKNFEFVPKELVTAFISEGGAGNLLPLWVVVTTYLYPDFFLKLWLL